MSERILRRPNAPYDLLYRSSPNNILWGAEPGRLLPMIKNFTTGKKVFDAGCGDGKNAFFLERNGFKVTGVDCSRLALQGLATRFQLGDLKPEGEYWVGNLLEAGAQNEYDVLVSYGLFHCLPSGGRLHMHHTFQTMVTLGGIVVFTCLTNQIPLPPGHGTFGINLAAIDEVFCLFKEWTIEYWQEGIIRESHPPVIGDHRHSAVWVIARRTNR